VSIKITNGKIKLRRIWNEWIKEITTIITIKAKRRRKNEINVKTLGGGKLKKLNANYEKIDYHIKIRK